MAPSSPLDIPVPAPDTAEGVPSHNGMNPVATTLDAPQKRLIKKRGPNYNHIHRNLLPVQTHPLPAFHPSNPLSLIRVAYIYLSQILSPPSSQLTERCVGYFSSETRSVHVTSHKHIRVLWEMGFFGKGLLSRSEPSWLEREQARLKAERGGGGTAEEATGRRREERRLFKLERARLEAERIRRQRLAEKGELEKENNGEHREPHDLAVANGHLPSPESALEMALTSKNELFLDTGRVSAADIVASVSPQIHTQSASIDANMLELKSTENGDGAETDITDHEHLQLSLEEAFFLSYGLGALDILTTSTTPAPPVQASSISTIDLLHLFSNHSTFPPTTMDPLLAPDSPFLLHYVVYHHFRSLGWVVRPGTKFSVDYLLYNRGPVFSHAEFAILIMPSYTDSYWSTKAGRKARKGNDAKSWSWLHCINRVQSQVRKTLVLCYVDIPARGQDLSIGSAVERQVDVGRLLRRYKIREFVVRRWLANRSRD